MAHPVHTTPACRAPLHSDTTPQRAAMQRSKTFRTAAAGMALLLFAAGTALAQAPVPGPARAAPGTAEGSHEGHSHGGPAPTAAAAAAPQPGLSEGEITRWDPGTLRLTLRHGEISNLGMPPMTMVFRVQDAAVLGSLQPGDRVRFRAAQAGGTYQVVHIEKAP